MKLESIVKNFLQTNCVPTDKILLGLSGGPDSLALLYLLLPFQKKMFAELGVAHVDHRWRPESTQEAQQLADLAKTLGLPFHLKTLDPNQLQGNLEAASREERINFFKAVCQENTYKAVLLGHQADDQAETVLKRICEGSNLIYLSALKSITKIDGLTLWRPLLAVSKKEILHWLCDREHHAFEDSTNLNTKYLRGRFRTQIIPELASNFGKEVSQSLCHIGQEAQELKAYLDDTLKHYLSKIEHGPLGAWLDFSESMPHKFALKHLLFEMARPENIFLTRTQAEIACELIISGKADKKIELGTHELHIDRKHVFLITSMPTVASEVQIIPGQQFAYGPWKVSVEEGSNSNLLGWKQVWRGQLRVTMPLEDCYLGPPSLQAPYPGHSPLSRWWTKQKVPAFMRSIIPVIWSQKKIRHEFLSGRILEHANEKSKRINVFLELRTRDARQHLTHF